MTGLVLCSLASGLAYDLNSLMAARVMGGLFGGPAGALATSVLADNIPVERRGRAMGAAMGSISIASVAGVPLGLILGNIGGWRLPFFVLTGLGLALIFLVLRTLPPQRAHLAAVAQSQERPFARVVRIALRPVSLMAFLLGIVSNVPNVMVQVNMPVFITLNLGFPRDDLWLIYVVTGVISFFGMQVAGRFTDRFGGTAASTIIATLTIIFIYLLYYDGNQWLPLPMVVLVPVVNLLTVVLYVAQSAVITRAAPPAERAGFMALYQSVQQISMAGGAVASSFILGTAANGSLTGMPHMVLFVLAMIVTGPMVMAVLERWVRRQSVDTAPASA
jgi:predicted MFS family arabinose efflux permease